MSIYTCEDKEKIKSYVLKRYDNLWHKNAKATNKKGAKVNFFKYLIILLINQDLYYKSINFRKHIYLFYLKFTK
ncbi:hypothetical protein LBMAG33_7250 [Candidatus Levyibacteriota bacterium]|nr:hypothetical protein LBMAG33_7250 [Candidatus Levybacteria bacterium]